MTGNNGSGYEALDRLVDSLVEDILQASDEEVLAEFREQHGDPEQYGVVLSELFEKAVLAVRKRRFALVRVAAETDGRSSARRQQSMTAAEGRRMLRRLMDLALPEVRLTLAARNESELSDSDVLEMLADLEELGLQLRGEDGKTS